MQGAKGSVFFPNKILFVHIPKTGGTSLEVAMASAFLTCENDHKTELQAYESFTINGHFRKLSRQKHGHPHSFIQDYSKHLNIDEYCKFVVLRDPFEQVQSLYNQLRIPANIPLFNDFILNKNVLNFRRVNHYIDQYAFTHINDVLCVDHVFTFDRYDLAQSFVESKFNIKIDREKKLWKTDYTGEALSLEAKQTFEEVHWRSIELYRKYKRS